MADTTSMISRGLDARERVVLEAGSPPPSSPSPANVPIRPIRPLTPQEISKRAMDLVDLATLTRQYVDARQAALCATLDELGAQIARQFRDPELARRATADVAAVAVSEARDAGRRSLDESLLQASRLRNEILDQRTLFRSKSAFIQQAGLGTTQRQMLEQTCATASPEGLATLAQRAASSGDLVLAACVLAEVQRCPRDERRFSVGEFLSAIHAPEWDAVSAAFQLADGRMQEVARCHSDFLAGRGTGDVERLRQAYAHELENLPALNDVPPEGDE